jgi:hypothetical protein
MTATLEGVSAKLGRANKHLDELDRLTQRFIATEPCIAVVEDDVQAAERRLRVQVREWPDSAHLGVVIGDVLHNLRSGLDHLAWIAGGDPPPNEKTSAFPIFKNKGRFQRDGLPLIRGAKQDVQRLIEDEQPWKDGDTADAHPFWRLRVLSNQDKHRLLAVVASASWGVTRCVPEMRDSLSQLVQRPITEDGEIIARWPLPDTTQPKPGKDFDVSFYVALDPKGPAGGRPVVDELRRIYSRVHKLSDSIGQAL